MGLRSWWLVLWTLITNSFWKFLPGGKLYTGDLKSFCHPGLNCYSCPAAVFACPIGSLQFFLAGLRSNWSAGIHQVGLYVLGFMGLSGALGGRFACGWLCPFGFMQELLYKVPLPKITLPKFLNYGKYVVLVLMVFLLPVLVLDSSGMGQVWFCKYLCPAGTLEAGIPLVTLKNALRSSIGNLFYFKLGILVFLLGVMLVARRPFCRTLCPLGGFYALFNKVSALKMRWNSQACTHCNNCFKTCPMELKFYEGDNQENCIRCLKCMQNCAFGAIKVEVGGE
jgi:ferredoxin-type protein NapH